LLVEKDLELSDCGHLRTIEGLTAEISSLSDRVAREEEQHREALADKEQEHAMKLSKLDERIRRVLAAKGEVVQMQSYLSRCPLDPLQMKAHHLSSSSTTIIIIPS